MLCLRVSSCGGDAAGNMTAVNFAKNEKTSAGGSGFLDVMPAPAGVAQQENMTIVNFTKKNERIDRR